MILAALQGWILHFPKF